MRNVINNVFNLLISFNPMTIRINLKAGLINRQVRSFEAKATWRQAAVHPADCCFREKEVRLVKKIWQAETGQGVKKSPGGDTLPGLQDPYFKLFRPLRPLSFLPQWKTCPRLPRAGRPPCPLYRRRPGWESGKPCIPGRGPGSCKHLK